MSSNPSHSTCVGLFFGNIIPPLFIRQNFEWHKVYTSSAPYNIIKAGTQFNLLLCTTTSLKFDYCIFYPGKKGDKGEDTAEPMDATTNGGAPQE